MIDWNMLAEEHKKISFEYEGQTIVGVVESFYDGTDDDPDEFEAPWFALRGHRVELGRDIADVSNVKILD